MPAAGMLIGTGLAGPLGSAARWAGAGILFVTAVWGLIEALRGGEHGEVVGAIVLIGIAGAMAMGWLLPPPVD